MKKSYYVFCALTVVALIFGIASTINAKVPDEEIRYRPTVVFCQDCFSGQFTLESKCQMPDPSGPCFRINLCPKCEGN
jgi:hypothetical protein